MEQKILNIIDALNNLKLCNNCGGKIINGTCIFCKNHYNSFEPLVLELEKIIKNEMNFKIFLELLNIKDLDIPFVNSLIDNNKNYFISFLVDQFNNKNYNEIIEVLTKENASYIIPAEEIFLYLVKDFYLNGTTDLTNDAYLKFINIYIEKILKNSNFKDLNDKMPSINFISNKEMKRIVHDKKNFGPTHGVCIQKSHGLYAIKLNRESFIQKKTKSLKLNMKTIYHEFQHIIQENYYRNPNRYSLVGLLIAKDEILERIIKTYYLDNYEILPVEANANYFAANAVIDDLKALNIYHGELDKELNEAKIISLNPYRIYKNEQININDLFDMFNITSDVLNLYPILSLEYKAFGPYLIKREKKEIESLISSNNDSEIDIILKYILQTFREEKRI